MEHLLAFLESVHPLSEELKLHLAGILKELVLPRKDFLLRAGSTSRRVCFIKYGLLRCFYSKDGIDISSWFMKEGDVIYSVESFLTQKPSYEYIQALEETSVFYITYEELMHIYETFPEFNYIGRALTEKYYVLSERRLYSLRMQRSQERYDYLLENHPELILRVPAKYLASYLGLTEVTLSKIKARN